MPYKACKCNTLLVPSGPKDKHLFFILNDACGEGCHLIVNVSTIYEGVPFDPACVLEAGEHPFVKHRSYIKYGMAEIRRSDKLEKMVAGWVYTPHQDADEALIARIIDGAYESDFIAKRIIKYLDGLPE